MVRPMELVFMYKEITFTKAILRIIFKMELVISTIKPINLKDNLLMDKKRKEL